MAEDLSEWIGFAADGSPRPKRALTCLPKMETPTPGGKPSQIIDEVKPQTKDGKKDEAKRKAVANRFSDLNKFVDATMRDLTPSERTVWVVVFRDVRDGIARVSQSDIATRSGLTQSTVSLAIKRLVDRGLLRVVHQGGFRKGLSTYRIRGSA